MSGVELRRCDGVADAASKTGFLAAAVRRCRSYLLGSDDPEIQAVGPLLAFRNEQQEAAYISSFHQSCRRQDSILFTAGVCFNTALVAKFAARRMLTETVLGLLETAFLARVACISSRNASLYLRHRVLLTAGNFSAHVVFSHLLAPGTLSPGGCSGPILFWLRELNLSQAPWVCLVCLAIPLPLKHAAWAQPVPVALALALLPRTRRLSEVLCPLSQPLYFQALKAVSSLFSCLIPGFEEVMMRDVFLEDHAGVSFWAIQIFIHVAFTALFLTLRFKSECQGRLAFAQQQGLAAEVRALQLRQCQYQLDAVSWVGLAALLWLLLLFLF